MFCLRFSNRYSDWPNKGLIGPTNLDKTGFVILSRKGKGVWGNGYLFETFKNSVFMFLLKTIHLVCLTKRGLCVIKQSLCIIQTEAHSCKERPLYMYSLCGYVSTLHVMCHMSCFFIYYFFFFGQNSQVFWWRVCYQRAYPSSF